MLINPLRAAPDVVDKRLEDSISPPSLEINYWLAWDPTLLYKIWTYMKIQIRCKYLGCNLYIWTIEFLPNFNLFNFKIHLILCIFLPHSARNWILNWSCALMRSRVGFKIRFDQPTDPPIRLLDLFLQYCAVSPP